LMSRDRVHGVRADHIGSLLRPKELLNAPSNIGLEDKAFAVKAYQVYDPQSREDIERFYDIYKKRQSLRARALCAGSGV